MASEFVHDEHLKIIKLSKLEAIDVIKRLVDQLADQPQVCVTIPVVRLNDNETGKFLTKLGFAVT